MKILLLLPLFLGFSVPVLVHNDANGGLFQEQTGVVDRDEDKDEDKDEDRDEDDDDDYDD